MENLTRWMCGLATGLLLLFLTADVGATARFLAWAESPLRERGADVRVALLVEYYRRLPERHEDEPSETWAVKMQEALEDFKHDVSMRYTEGTLQRILTSSDEDTRKAAVAALGLIATTASNKALTGRLHDESPDVRQLAADALWAIWFRADTEANCKELQRLMRLRDAAKALAGFDALLKKTPKFAEAINQRAVLYFRMGEYQKSIRDCETALKLNPCHFGAQAGIGQCLMKLRRPRPALKAFRASLRINPNLEGVEDAIRTLEEVLDEEGRRDDKK